MSGADELQPPEVKANQSFLSWQLLSEKNPCVYIRILEEKYQFWPRVPVQEGQFFSMGRKGGNTSVSGADERQPSEA